MLEKFEYNSDYKKEEPSPSIGIFVASLEQGNYSANLCRCYDKNDSAYSVVDTYVGQDKADSLPVRENIGSIIFSVG